MKRWGRLKTKVKGNSFEASGLQHDPGMDRDYVCEWKFHLSTVMRIG